MGSPRNELSGRGHTPLSRSARTRVRSLRCSCWPTAATATRGSATHRTQSWPTNVPWVSRCSSGVSQRWQNVVSSRSHSVPSTAFHSRITTPRPVLPRQRSIDQDGASAASTDSDACSAVEAEARAKGLDPWEGRCQLDAYKVRVRCSPACPPLNLNVLAGLAVRLSGTQ